MPHSTNKELIFGIMVGTAGISLLVLWYHKIRKPRSAMSFPKLLSLGKTFEPIAFQVDTENSQETGAVFQRRQLQILEKLNELLTNMEELKEEIKFLKETIPKLEEYIQDELGGKIIVHKISPQHRARKRRPTAVQSSATSNSSEEAESEGGCCKEDQNFQLNCSEEQVTSHSQHLEFSSTSQPNTSPGLKTSHSSATYNVSSPKGSGKLSSPPRASHPYFSGRKKSIFSRLQKSHVSLYRHQSRANFDSEEDTSFSDFKSASEHVGAFKCRRRFSSYKLSIVSSDKSDIFFDDQPNGHDVFIRNEMDIFPKSPDNGDAQKHIAFSDPQYTPKRVQIFETTCSTCQTERLSCYQSVASFFSFSTCTSCNPQTPSLATDIQESGLPSAESEDDLHPRPQRHSTNHVAVALQQLPSRSVTPLIFQNGGFSSYKNASSFITPLSDLASDPCEEENLAVWSQDEDKALPIEITKIRYITANTDTEEQSFPVLKAFNTPIDELKLDVLLQKVDNLRMQESGKMESFELLCDHKEKFKEEVEFMWRFARAYGDMFELSTNAQEKKHFANVGKNVGERAITRAPMNGHCHLWYAILCGYVSQFEGLQNKINYGQRFKEHLDTAIQFLPEEPFLYYLKGRYCYTVSKLSWIEKKMAATLFGKIPSSTVQEALCNFLKAEELHPGYSIPNYMYMVKCYVDLEENQNAWKFCHLALLLPVVTKEDQEAQKEVKTTMASLKRVVDVVKEETPDECS